MAFANSHNSLMCFVLRILCMKIDQLNHADSTGSSQDGARGVSRKTSLSNIKLPQISDVQSQLEVAEEATESPEEIVDVNFFLTFIFFDFF